MVVDMNTVNQDNTRPCRACGMPIRFVEGPNGKRIPAQRIRTVYVLGGGLFDQPRLEVSDVGESYVSHFETCPSANQFSQRKESK